MEVDDKNGTRKRSSLWNFTIDEIVKLLEESRGEGLAGLFSRMGYPKGGGKYATLKKRMSDAGIDIREYMYSKGEKANNTKITYDDVFCENSKHSRWAPRKLILKDNLIKYECEKCGNDGNWNGIPLTLQLEHKNGISNDHRIENLCFLCPNCHAQTETWGAKNIKLGRVKHKCSTDGCSNLVFKLGNNCKSCYGASIRKVKRPSQAELEKDVAELGYKGCGQKYGVGANTTKAWLLKYKNANGL